jgi:tetratricopeptide (TPR) repeat protein
MTGKYEECLKAIKVAMEVAPGSFDLQVFKAKCFIRLNFPIVAKGIVEKLIVEDPDNETLVFLQGVVKFYLGQLEEGLKYVKRAIEIDPEERKYSEMKEKIKKLLEPVQKAKQLGASRQYEAAVSIFTRQINSPDVHSAWCFELLIMRAQTYKAFLQFDQAIADISRAFILPDVYNINESHLELRAECYYAKGDYNNCIVDCERALRTSDTYTLKLLLKKANEKKKLEEILEKIEDNKLQEAYEMSYQNFQETRNGEFFIFAIQCARELKNKNTIAKLLESIREDEELLDVVRMSVEQHEEETMTTPDEFTEAMTCYNDGNFGKCIEILTNAKKGDVQIEKFPYLTYHKAQKILKHVIDGE